MSQPVPITARNMDSRVLGQLALDVRALSDKMADALKSDAAGTVTAEGAVDLVGTLITEFIRIGREFAFLERRAARNAGNAQQGRVK